MLDALEAQANPSSPHREGQAARDIVEQARMQIATLVGAGGGSVLVPVLLLMMPNESPATLTGISLAVVFFNAYSGTVAYMRLERCGISPLLGFKLRVILV